MELLTPIQVGNITLKNRIIFPPLTTGYEGRDGSITDQSIAFYTRLARGGVSYIVLGDVSPVPSFSPTPRLFQDEQIEGFAKLADSVHAYGAKIGVQIFHPEYDVAALMDLFRKKDMMGVRQKMHHDMEHFVTEVSRDQLLSIIDTICACAVRAQKAGIDFIQVHGDRLVGCLCSPVMNHRTDEFGGSFENRTRFALMLVKALRQAVPNMGIEYKFSVITPERGKGGIPLEEGPAFAKLLEQAGVDMLHVAQANHTGNLADTIPLMGVQPYGFFVEIAAKIKASVAIPVSCVGRIVDPEMAERIVCSKQADLVAVGRPLLADPDWVAKLEAGKRCDIRRCIFCNKGCTDNIQNRSFLSCVLNAENGYELTRCITPAPVAKKVVVVGGGIAGMEAARVAAAKGHQVVLFEKQTQLGGQLNIACVPPRKEELRRATQDLVHAVTAAGVDLRMGQAVTCPQILAEHPDAVIVAVGAASFMPSICGIDGPNVCDAWKVLAGEQQVYGRVVVVGGGILGCELTEYLAEQGCKVSIVEMTDKIAQGESTTILPTVMETFARCGVQQYTNHTVCSIQTDGVTCRDKDENLVSLPCDYVVIAAGARPVAFDTLDLQAAGIPVVYVGDCGEHASDISNAIRTAYDAANSL